jgi:hypothetical protein
MGDEGDAGEHVLQAGDAPPVVPESAVRLRLPRGRAVNCPYPEHHGSGGGFPVLAALAVLASAAVLAFVATHAWVLLAASGAAAGLVAGVYVLLRRVPLVARYGPQEAADAPAAGEAMGVVVPFPRQGGEAGGLRRADDV